MGKSGRRSERLAEIAARVGIQQDANTTKLLRPALPTTTNDQKKRVAEALNRTRTTHFGTKNPFLRRAFSTSTITEGEATTTLQNLVEANCSAGEALCLIQHGAKVNLASRRSSGILNRVRSVNQEGIRSNIFQNAIKNGDVMLINVLVDGADAANVNEGLQAALKMRSAEIVAILVIAGADPNLSIGELKEIIRARETDLFYILSAGKIRLSAETASECLFEAVHSGQSKFVHILLASQADADQQDPSALEHAVEMGSIEIVLALCRSSRFPSASHLARCTAKLCKEKSSKIPNRLLIIETLLAAGAEGEIVGESLVGAASRNESEVVELLMDFCDCDAPQLLIAAEATITNKNFVLFYTIVQGVNDPGMLDRILGLLQCYREHIPLEIKLTMTIRIVERGPSLESMSRNLIAAVKFKELEIVRILLKHQASVDFESGRAICESIEQNSPHILSMLLEHNPSQATLLLAMSHLTGLSLHVKLQMTPLLIHAGVKGPIIDKALDLAVAQCDKSAENYELIEILLKAGALVKVNRGGNVLSAVRNRDDKALNLLLSDVHPSMDLEPAFLAANKISNANDQYRITNLLLDSGHRGPSVTRQLMHALESSKRDDKYIRLLVERGDPDVNLFEGRVVSQAIVNHDIELLMTLLQRQPNQSTLNNALKPAMKSDQIGIRFTVCKILLQAGARGQEVDEALILATLSKPYDLALLKMFIHANASIDYKTASALQVALHQSDNQMLDILLTNPASPGTLIRVLRHALELEDEQRKTAVIASLLNTETELDPVALGTLLPGTFDRNSGLTLLRMFLERRASVNVEPPATFQKAIELNLDKVVALLLESNTIPSIQRSVFEYAWRARKANGYQILTTLTKDAAHLENLPIDQYMLDIVANRPCHTSDLHFLVRLNTSVGCMDSNVTREVINNLDLAALGVLVQYVQSKSDISKMFVLLMRTSKVWIEVEGLDCMKLLLKNGASGDILDENLLLAVERHKSHANAAAVAESLIQHGAKSDYQNGKCFEVAMRWCSTALIVRLFDTNPSAITIQNVFHWVLMFQAKEVEIQSLVSLCLKANGKLDMNSPNHDSIPAVFQCIEPGKEKLDLLGDLLRAGASPDQTLKSHVELFGETEDQETSALFWSVRHSPSETRGTIVEVLCRNGANTNFVTSKTRLTPLLAAAKHSDSTVAKILLRFGSDISAADEFGRTALCMAALLGNIELLQTVVEAKAPVNDGSLHYAACRLDSKAVTILLRTGHGPNFPSPIHDMQGTLEAVIQGQTVQKPSWQLTSILKALVENGANPRYRNKGKSLLFIGLDMPNAQNIIPSILEAFMGPLINEEFNLLEHEGFILSALSYVKKDLQLSPTTQKEVLMKTLSLYGCSEIYYSKEGLQPADFVGAPQELVQRERDRREHIRKVNEIKELHQVRLQTIEEEKAARIKAEDKIHGAAQKHFKSAHGAEMIRITEKARHQELVMREAAKEQLDIEDKKNDRIERALKRQISLELARQTQSREAEQALLALAHDKHLATSAAIADIHAASEKESHKRHLEAIKAYKRLIDKYEALAPSERGPFPRPPASLRPRGFGS